MLLVAENKKIHLTHTLGLLQCFNLAAAKQGHGQDLFACQLQGSSLEWLGSNTCKIGRARNVTAEKAHFGPS